MYVMRLDHVRDLIFFMFQNTAAMPLALHEDACVIVNHTFIIGNQSLFLHEHHVFL